MQFHALKTQGSTLGVDLRQKVVDAIKNGMSQTDAESIFNVARRTIYSWLLIQEKTGSLDRSKSTQTMIAAQHREPSAAATANQSAHINISMSLSKKE